MSMYAHKSPPASTNIKKPKLIFAGFLQEFLKLRHIIFITYVSVNGQQQRDRGGVLQKGAISQTHYTYVYYNLVHYAMQCIQQTIDNILHS